MLCYRRLFDSSQSCSSRQTVPLKHNDINKETAEQTGRRGRQQGMTAKALQRKEPRENKPRSPREQPLQWNVIKATTTGKPSRATRIVKRRRRRNAKKDELRSRCQPGQPKEPVSALVIGLSRPVLGLRAFACQRKGWLEALGNEERLKLLRS